MIPFFTADEILQLVTSGVCQLAGDVKVTTESYEESDWYNDPNNTMSHHHY